MGFHRPHLATSYVKKYARNVQGILPSFNTPKIAGATDFLHSFASRDDTETGRQYTVRINKSWKKIITKQRKRTHSLFSIKYENTVLEMNTGYLRGSKYLLSNIGILLENLDAYNLSKNTHIVFLSDHGWQIGQRKQLGKNGLGSAATDIPFVFHVAGQTGGQFSQQPVSQIDLFPTLIHLNFGAQAVIDFKDRSKLPLDGKSLVPALKDAKQIVNKFVISQYPRCQAVGVVQTADCMTAPNNNQRPCNKGGGRPPILYMGYAAIYADGRRHTEWHKFNEQQTECSAAKWPDMPDSIVSWGKPAWQINPSQSCTDWNSPGIQPEFYRSIADEEEANNLAFEPSITNLKLINEASSDIRTTLEKYACRT